MSEIRAAFEAGMDYGIDWSLTHDPAGPTLPSDSEKREAYQSWVSRRGPDICACGHLASDHDTTSPMMPCLEELCECSVFEPEMGPVEEREP